MPMEGTFAWENEAIRLDGKHLARSRRADQGRHWSFWSVPVCKFNDTPMSVDFAEWASLPTYFPLQGI